MPLSGKDGPIALAVSPRTRKVSGVSTVLGVFDATYSILRIAFLVLAIVFGVLCILDWLVRTRRVNPMGSLGRFVRRSIEPFSHPSSAVRTRGGAPRMRLSMRVAACSAVSAAYRLDSCALSCLRLGTSGPVSAACSSSCAVGVGLLQIALIVRVSRRGTIRHTPEGALVLLLRRVLLPSSLSTVGRIDITRWRILRDH